MERENNLINPKSIVSLESLPIENVKIFRYLGEEVKSDKLSIGDAKIDLRINIAQGIFYDIIKKLTNFKIHLSTRVMIFNSLKLSILLLPNPEFVTRSNAKINLRMFICYKTCEK